MAIAQDAVSSATRVDGTNTISWSHTCTGSDLTLVVCIMWRDDTTSGAPTVSTCTYNGVGMTSQGRTSYNFVGDNYLTAEIFTLDDPATGSNTISATLSESNDSNDNLHGSAVSYTGSQGIGATTGSSSGNSTTADVTFTTEESTSKIVACSVAESGGAQPITEGSGVSQLYEDNGGAQQGSAWMGEMDATGGSDTVGITQNAVRDFATFAIEVKEAVAAGGDVLVRGLSNIASGVVASQGGGYSGLHPISEGFVS